MNAIRFTHHDLDGKWNRLLLDGTLECRDPNSGQGWEIDEKPRQQYRVIDGVPMTRRLPPERVGDCWFGFTEPPEWEPVSGIVVWSLLSEYFVWAGAKDDEPF